VPQKELDGEIGDSHVGLQARLMSQSMRKLTGAIARSKTAVIFINQIREKIGVMFGSPKTTSGGKALKFYASVRMEITRIGSVKKGDEIIGNRTKIKITKNKMAPPFRQAEFEIYYGEGVSREAELIDLGVQAGVVRKSGSWYAKGDERLGQGKENARQYLKDNPQIAALIHHEVLQFNGIIPADVPVPEAPAAAPVAEA
jgi:recombination protein RecA